MACENPGVLIPRAHSVMRRVLASLLILTTLVAAGCARRPGPGPGTLVDTTRGIAGPVGGEAGLVVGGAQDLMPRGPYRLDTGDRLRIIVFGQEGLTNSYSVDPAGHVSLPLIGAVPAAGRTTSELAATVSARLREGFLRDPSVTVEVDIYRPFFILGEVTTGGQFPFVNGMTVQTAVAIAGGFTPRANRTSFEVTRRVNGQLMRADVPATHPVMPGDTILVRERWF